MKIEVVYALPDRHAVVEVEAAAGATRREIVERSGLLARFREIDLARDGIGVFGRPAAIDEPARAGERIEIYRPLLADPKEQRRRRAAQRAGRTAPR